MAGACVGVVPVLVTPLLVVVPILAGVLVAIGGTILAMLRPAALKKFLISYGRHLAMLLALVVAFFVLLSTLQFTWAYATGTYRNRVGAAEGSDAAWPMFRGGLGRAGAAPGGPGPAQGGLNWAFDREVRTFYSSVAIVGNRVYATSADKGVFTDRGAIWCLDADTGGVVWKAAPPGMRATFSSPAVSGRHLVVGEGLHFTRDARIFCLDVADGGKVLWEFRTGSHVESSPCIYQGRAYIGAGDDGYYCLDLAPDASGRPRVVWHVPGEKYPDAETPPAAADGKVYVGLGMGGKAVSCLDADTGRELWRTPTPYPVFTPPTVVGGAVLVGMGNGNFIETAEQVRAKELDRLRKAGATDAQLAEAEKQLRPVGEVWCLDKESGAKRWSVTVGRTVLGAACADADALFFGSRDGHFYAVSHEGRTLGRWDAHAPIVASPALTARHVYVATETGRLYALERETLRPVWETALGTEGPFLSSPTVARGRVYVGSQADGLLCLGQPAAAEAVEMRWAGPLGGPGRPGSLDLSPLPKRGALIWRYTGDSSGDADAPAAAVTAPAACLGDRLFVPVADGPKKGLVCLKHDPSGRLPAAELWSFETALGVRLSPAATIAEAGAGEDLAIIVEGAAGQEGRRLFALDAATGSVRWSAPVAAEASGCFLLADDGVFIQDQPGALANLDLDGSFRWRAPVGTLAGPVDLEGLIVVAATIAPPALRAMDRLGGATLWEVPLPAAPTTGPVVARKMIYVGTAAGVEARRLVDGAPVWQAEGGAASTALVLGRERIAYVSAAGDVVLVDRAGGEGRATVGGAIAGVPPIMVRDTVLYAADGAVMACTPAGGTPERWMDISWLGPVSSPMIAAEGRVYFGAQGRGLICAGRWRR
jgi:outer membrane protein assembly factor BamB